MMIAILACVAVACVAVWYAVWRWRRGAARRRGRDGEKAVAKVLRRLPHRDYRVFNDIWIDAGKGNQQIDHLVVSTRGIFVIETKAHAGFIHGHEQAQYWEQKFRMSSRSFYNPLLQNGAHIKALTKDLQKLFRQADFREDASRLPEGWADDWMVSAVVFTGAWRLEIGADDRISDRDIFGSRRYARTLDPAQARRRRWWQRGGGVELDEKKIVMQLGSLRKELQRRPRVMSREEMELLEEAVEALVKRPARSAQKEHNAYVQATAKNKREQIARGVCPRCGGMLVLRQGDYGPFYGCSRYPACRFICSAAPDK